MSRSTRGIGEPGPRPDSLTARGLAAARCVPGPSAFLQLRVRTARENWTGLLRPVAWRPGQRLAHGPRHDLPEATKMGSVRGSGVVGVVMGGWGEEREISLRTGEAVAQALEERGKTVRRITTGE